MTFINPLLLLGAGMVALPVVLHLMMRRRPKHLEFPALRFLQRRQDTNRRTLRLRHLLLLLLRMGAIALLAFALARPNVKLYGAWGSQEAPVAAALVVDTSKRMEYRHDNRSRLEVAQEMARTLMSRLPEGSQVAVLDTGPGAAAFQVDLGAARHRLQRLETAGNPRVLTAVLSEALRLVRTSELSRREVYVFTDLARAAWPGDAASQLQEAGSEGDVGVYLVDVGVAEPVNTALGDVKLSAETLSARSPVPLRIETDIAHRGPAVQRTVELYVEQGKADTPDEKTGRTGRPLVKQGQQTVSLTPGQAQRLEFRVSGLDLGTHQGRIRIVGQDGLEADDCRYFTVEVSPPWRILLAAPSPAPRYAVFLAEALAPSVFRRTGEVRFACEVVPMEKLAEMPLDEYSAVCLLDPPPLEGAVWQRLASYAASGRGVAVFLGRNAERIETFNSGAAQDLLAVKLLRVARAPDGVWLAPQGYDHPVLAGFRGLPGSVPWDAFPVFRYWQVGPPKQDSAMVPVVPFNDGRPALLSRRLGQGRVVVMTTPVSDPPSDRQTWNLLPSGEAWPFLILMHGLASHLSGGADGHFNFYTGQPVVLSLETDRNLATYVLTTPEPGSVDLRLSVNQAENRLSITATDKPGNYRVRAGGERDGVDRGFSVNLPRAQTDLERLSPEEIKTLFGSVPHRVARNLEKLEGDQAEVRMGRDLFPFLIVLLAVVLAAEHLLANRFYRENRPIASRGA